MRYEKFRYIYPPRPEIKIPALSLQGFEDEGLFLGQPKLNGSSMLLFTDGKELHIMNRHKKLMVSKIDKEELLGLHKGKGWMVLCGELMNKSQRDEDNKVWNLKFAIWDLLVFEGKYLIGSTFEERVSILRTLYPDNLVKKHLHQISENCFRVNTIITGFVETYNDITLHQMYEGFVLKRRDGKLDAGWQVANNVRTQMKCRKPTKNYAF